MFFPIITLLPLHLFKKEKIIYLLTYILQANSLGVPTDLIRTSVGLEDPADLRGRIERALAAAAKVSKKS